MMKTKHILICIICLFVTYALITVGFLNNFSLNGINVEKNGEKKAINIWGWDRTLERAFDEYEKSHPSLNIIFTYVPITEYGNKLRMSIASSRDLPDICILSNEIMPQFKNLEIWAELEKTPFNLNRSDLLDYSIASVENDQKQIIGVPYEVSVTGIAYRKSLAKRLLGIDDARQMNIMFKSWADVLSLGTSLKETAKEDFYFFAAIEDPGIMMFSQTSQAYEEDGKLLEPQRFYNYFKVLFSLRDKMLIDNLQQYSPQWYDSYKSHNYLFYPCGISTAQQGIFAAKDDFESDWSLSVPPTGSYEGSGSSWVIVKNGVNVEESWQLTKDMLLSISGARYHKNRENGIFINYQPAYALNDYRDLYQKDFGNQNIGMMYFNRLLPNVFRMPNTARTAQIKTIYTRILQQAMLDRSMDAQQAYDAFIVECQLNGMYLEEEMK